VQYVQIYVLRNVQEHSCKRIHIYKTVYFFKKSYVTKIQNSAPENAVFVLSLDTDLDTTMKLDLRSS
jgi:hypothetical protein